MSDFVSGFWNIYVMSIVLVSVIGCGVFLWMQSSATHVAGQTTGHVWDEDLQEYSNPLPNWWRWMFYITIVLRPVLSWRCIPDSETSRASSAGHPSASTAVK
jgi:hypothetical protein